MRGVGHDRDEVVVLGGGADHGRAADVDILDRGFGIGLSGDGLFEGVEVDGDEIDRRDRVLFHLPEMLRQIAAGEDAAMDLRHQRLDAPVHDFGEAGMFGDVVHRNAGLADGLRGAAGRENFGAGAGQCLRKRDEPRLVGDGDEGAADGNAGGSRSSLGLSGD